MCTCVLINRQQYQSQSPVTLTGRHLAVLLTIIIMLVSLLRWRVAMALTTAGVTTSHMYGGMKTETYDRQVLLRSLIAHFVAANSEENIACNRRNHGLCRIFVCEAWGMQCLSSKLTNPPALCYTRHWRLISDRQPRLFPTKEAIRCAKAAAPSAGWSGSKVISKVACLRPYLPLLVQMSRN